MKRPETMLDDPDPAVRAMGAETVLLQEARAICAEARPDYAAGFLSGEYDKSSTEMRAVMIALQRRATASPPTNETLEAAARVADAYSDQCIAERRAGLDVDPSRDHGAREIARLIRALKSQPSQAAPSPGCGDDEPVRRGDGITFGHLRALASLKARAEAAEAEVERLTRRAEFTEQWYAERIERLKDLGKAYGCWPEMAAIIANGTSTRQLDDGSYHYEPPTYAQQLNTAKHRAEAAEARAERLESALREIKRTDRYGHAGALRVGEIADRALSSSEGVILNARTPSLDSADSTEEVGA